jgi:hypothetical protein
MGTAIDAVRVQCAGCFGYSRHRCAFHERGKSGPFRKTYLGIVVILYRWTVRPRGALVCTENLNPHIMVMKPTKDWARTNDPSPLNWAREWRIFVQ